MRPPRRAFTPRHALALGLLQGPTELLPISSSAHTIVLARLAGWPYAELDPALRKSFEVSLHAGGALALALAARRQLGAAARALDRRELAALALSSAPAAVAGYLLEARIERLGRQRELALALSAGAVAMVLADTRAPRRSLGDANAADALAIGVAQALALIPGVSRSGAALAAARARGFAREDAHTLTWRAAAPLLAGASALRLARAARRGLPAGSAGLLGAGAAGAFCSTLACARVLRSRRVREAPLAPFALYRVGLAGLASARGSRSHPEI
jgi:undecaprenyl-diphosphatase